MPFKRKFGEEAVSVLGSEDTENRSLQVGVHQNASSAQQLQRDEVEPPSLTFRSVIPQEREGGNCNVDISTSNDDDDK